MTISIRPLESSDLQALKSMRLKALQSHSGVYLGTYQDAIAFPDSVWLNMLDQNGKCVFGLYDDEKIIGITAVFTHKEDPEGTTGFCGMSYIEPDYRGRGLSKFLHEARIARGMNYLPWKRLVIGHREGNEASRRAIMAQGFQFTGKKKITWPDGTEGWDYNYALDLEKLRRAQQ